MKKRKISAFTAFLFVTSLLAVPVSAATAPPSAPTTVDVTNGKTGADDIVYVTLPSGVTTAQSISITYGSTTTTQAIGASDAGKKVTFNLGKDKLTKTGGSVSVKVTEGTVKSSAVAKTYLTQVSGKIDKGTAVNEYGTDKDKVTIKAKDALKAGDIVTVYTDKELTKTTTVGAITLSSDVAAGATADIPVKFTGTAKGSVYVAVTQSGKDEGDRVKVDYLAEPKTLADFIKANQKIGTETKATANVIVTNTRSGQKPTVVIRGGLKGDEIITVYTTKSGSGSTTTYSGVKAVIDLSNPDSSYNVKTTSAAINVLTARIGTDGKKPVVTAVNTSTSTALKFNLADTLNATGSGKVYITIKAPNATVSDAFEVSYKAPDSKAVESKYVQVLNDDASKGDLIRVAGLAEGDTVYVFNATDGAAYEKTASTTVTTSKAIAVATVASGKTGVTLKTFDLPAVDTKTGKGTVYLLVQRDGMNFSKSIKISYIDAN